MTIGTFVSLTLERLEPEGFLAAVIIANIISQQGTKDCQWFGESASNVPISIAFTNADRTCYRFSAEVAGTIMVQCIPVLLPVVRDVKTSLSSRRIDSTKKTGTSETESQISRFTTGKTDDDMLDDLEKHLDRNSSKTLNEIRVVSMTPSEERRMIRSSHTRPLTPLTS
jgi:hypothetical protein